MFTRVPRVRVVGPIVASTLVLAGPVAAQDRTGAAGPPAHQAAPPPQLGPAQWRHSPAPDPADVPALLDRVLMTAAEARAQRPADRTLPVGAEAMAALGPEAWRAMPRLFLAFADPTDRRGDLAADLLGRFGGDAGPLFAGAMNGPAAHPVRRRRALIGIAAMGDRAGPLADEVLPAFRDGADAPTLALAMRVVRANRTSLAGPRGEPAVRALRALVRADGHPLRGDALRTLVAGDPSDGVAEAVAAEAVGDPKHPLHAVAFDLAGSFGENARVRDAVLPLLDHPDARVRCEAAVALSALDPAARTTGDALLTAVRRKDYAVRSLLAASVRRAPAAAIRVGPVLAELSDKDPDEAVRTQARNALAELESAAWKDARAGEGDPKAGEAGAADGRPAAPAPLADAADGPRARIADEQLDALLLLAGRGQGALADARARAVELLAQAAPADPRVWAAMEAGLSDPAGPVRAAAARGLAVVATGRRQVDPGVSGKVWRLALGDPDPAVRDAARLALQTMGPAATAAGLRVVRPEALPDDRNPAPAQPPGGGVPQRP